MKDSVTLEKIRESKVCAIIRGIPKDKIKPVVDALIKGGVTAVEVTFNTDGAEQMIRELKSLYGDELLIGAGTVLDPETAKDAISAGASFILAPTLNTEVIKLCLRYNVVAVPGVTTPTEALTAWESGARIVKIFPAGVLGANYIKQLKGPLPQIDMMVVGAVGAANLKDFFKAGASSAGIGGELVNKDLVAAGDYEEIERRASEFSRIVGDFKHES